MAFKMKKKGLGDTIEAITEGFDDKKKGDQAPVFNEADKTVKIDGELWKFQSLEALNAYKKAAGL